MISAEIFRTILLLSLLVSLARRRFASRISLVYINTRCCCCSLVERSLCVVCLSVLKKISSPEEKEKEARETRAREMMSDAEEAAAERN